jgi:hypothetical protein
MTAPAPIAMPWRAWAKNNSLGVNFTWRAISAGRLKVKRIGKRMIILNEDGLAFLRGLPDGPNAVPENLKRAAGIAPPPAAPRHGVGSLPAPQRLRKALGPESENAPQGQE